MLDKDVKEYIERLMREDQERTESRLMFAQSAVIAILGAVLIQFYFSQRYGWFEAKPEPVKTAYVHEPVSDKDAEEFARMVQENQNKDLKNAAANPMPWWGKPLPSR